MRNQGASPPGQLAVLLRAHRDRAGLTRRQLAGQAGISLGAVQDLEQGRTLRPRPESLAALAAALRLSPGQLAELARAIGDCGLRVEVLGPLAAWRDGLPVPLGPVRQRAVLGLLALHAGTSLHRAAIIDALWGEDPPPTAAAMVQAIVSRIRRLMGGPPGGHARLPWDGSGYRFIPDGIGLDVTQFGELTGQADERLAAADAAGACELYERALALWRGEPLDGIEVLYAHHSITKLARWRGDVVIKYAGAAASAGRPERVIPHLESLTSRDPLDERAAAHLMLMLAATGRQSAALRLHQDLAGRLHRELGVRPGAELSAAHLRVVREQVPAGVRAGADRGWAARRRVVPRLLPPGVPGFAGPAAELAALDHVARQAGATMVISVIGGPAGVGKTALALHWAHQVAGAFPDGQLHASLRGSEPAGQPGPATAAMRLFLDSLGVPPERIPASLDAQAALYRSLLAGRKMLIVLDDARDPQQVRPLLPGAPGCLVLITSRNQLTGLAAADGAHLLTLTALHQDALALFDRLNFPGAGVLRSGLSRPPQAVTAVAGQTGGAR